jgi:hypothetical protein
VRPLSAGATLHAWERGAGQHPLDRALTLLQAAEPGATRGELAALPVGERDARLLRLRAATLGPSLAAFTACPACGERLETAFDTTPLLADAPADAPLEARGGGVRMRFRLPDSRDLAAAAGSGSVEAARRALAGRCVLEAFRDDGAAVAPPELPDAALGALSEAMGRAAPAADVTLALSCAECGHAWEAALDVGPVFWAEVAARARVLLREVHSLAAAYHWSEAEVLAMSPARRRAYLQMVQE